MRRRRTALSRNRRLRCKYGHKEGSREIAPPRARADALTSSLDRPKPCPAAFMRPTLRETSSAVIRANHAPREGRRRRCKDQEERHDCVLPAAVADLPSPRTTATLPWAWVRATCALRTSIPSTETTTTSRCPSAATCPRSSTSISARAHECSCGLVFRLTTRARHHRGTRALARKGAPYAFAWVMPDVWAMAGRTPKGHVKGSLVSESPMVRTDQEGKFAISVSPGSYVVMAGKSGYQLLTKTVNPEQQHIFQNMQVMLNKLPAQYRESGSLQTLGKPQPGAYLTGQTAVANLMLAKAPSPLRGAHPGGPAATPSFTPHGMALVGPARLSPNNVLFFTWRHPQSGHEAAGAAIIVRSRFLLGGGKVDPLKARQSPLPRRALGSRRSAGVSSRTSRAATGAARREWRSIRLPTPSAKPGVNYYYSIFETRSFTGVEPLDFTNIGLPHSNVLKLHHSL